LFTLNTFARKTNRRNAGHTRADWIGAWPNLPNWVPACAANICITGANCSGVSSEYSVDEQSWGASRAMTKSAPQGTEGYAVKDVYDSENNPMFYYCTYRITCKGCKMDAANVKICSNVNDVRQGIAVWAKCRDANNAVITCEGVGEPPL